MADDRTAGGSLAGIRRGYNGFPADAAVARGNTHSRGWAGL
ncbi:hypothetical protein V4V36_07125 [Paenibacillus lautus]